MALEYYFYNSIKDLIWQVYELGAGIEASFLLKDATALKFRSYCYINPNLIIFAAEEHQPSRAGYLIIFDREGWATRKATERISHLRSAFLERAAIEDFKVHRGFYSEEEHWAKPYDSFASKFMLGDFVKRTIPDLGD